jgi:hypothetical protein
MALGFININADCSSSLKDNIYSQNHNLFLLAKIILQSSMCFENRFITLAESKSQQVARQVHGFRTEEGRRGNRGHTHFFGQPPGKEQKRNE